MIAIDKQAHAWSGAYGAALLWPRFGLWAVLAVVAAGWAKEWLFDASGHGTKDWRDFAATCVGALVGALSAALLGALP